MTFQKLAHNLCHSLTALTLSLSIGVQAEATDASPRNVILIIGDGMDDHQITIARNYLKGARGQLTLDRLPLRSATQVLTVAEDDPDRSVYVADSANSATAMATGIVSSRGRIATTAQTDEDVETIIEMAQTAGLKTGIVSTASITDATPASFIAHISSRGCENPDMMQDAKILDRVSVDCSQDMIANGGKGSIAEQMAASDVDVLLGGGAKHFRPNVEGSQHSVKQAAADNNFHIVQTLAGLQHAPSDKKLLGLFSEDTMPVRLRGENGRQAEKPTPSLLNYAHQYLGSVELPSPMTCEPNPDFKDIPNLRQMTEAALTHLNQNNNQGFFLVIESASIDKQSHDRNTCGHIGELEQLEESLQVALKFSDENSNTLILVTADHGQAAQMIPNESLFDAFGVPVYTPGHLVRVKTPEGSVMAVNYATNDFAIEEHTGVNVPLFANKAGLGLVPAMVAQPQIFELMKSYLRLPYQPLAGLNSAK
jgi:alkaline phosphatase